MGVSLPGFPTRGPVTKHPNRGIGPCRGMHKKTRRWNLKEEGRMMVLGRYLGLEHVVGLSLMGLVGKFSYKAMNRSDIVEWVESSWCPEDSYCLYISILSKGW